MSITYQIKTGYVVLYTYRSWNGLAKRLIELAKWSALGSVTVVTAKSLPDQGGTDTASVQVVFKRGPFGHGWETPVGHGIERKEGLWCSGISTSR